MDTLTYAKQLLTRYTSQAETAKDETDAAKAAAKAAEDARNDFRTELFEKPAPEGAREKLDGLENAVLLARGRVAQAVMAERRSKALLDEAQARVERLIPFAQQLLAYGKALEEVAAAEGEVAALVESCRAQLAKAIRGVQAQVEVANTLWAKLPVAIRFGDAPSPLSAAPRFGALDPDAPDLLRRLPTTPVNPAVGAPRAAVGTVSTPVPWARGAAR